MTDAQLHQLIVEWYGFTEEHRAQIIADIVRPAISALDSFPGQTQTRLNALRHMHSVRDTFASAADLVAFHEHFVEASRNLRFAEAVPAEAVPEAAEGRTDGFAAIFNFDGPWDAGSPVSPTGLFSQAPSPAPSSSRRSASATPSSRRSVSPPAQPLVPAAPAAAAAAPAGAVAAVTLAAFAAAAAAPRFVAPAGQSLRASGVQRWTLEEHNAFVNAVERVKDAIRSPDQNAEAAAEAERWKKARKWAMVLAAEPLLSRFNNEQLRDRWKTLGPNRRVVFNTQAQIP